MKKIGKEENVFIVSDICKRIYINMKCLGRQLDIRSVKNTSSFLHISMHISKSQLEKHNERDTIHNTICKLPRSLSNKC